MNQRSQPLIQYLLSLLHVISFSPQHILIVVQQPVPLSTHLCDDLCRSSVLASLMNQRSQLVLQYLLSLHHVISFSPQHILIVVQQPVPLSTHLCDDLCRSSVLASVVSRVIKQGIGAPAKLSTTNLNAYKPLRPLCCPCTANPYSPWIDTLGTE